MPLVIVSKYKHRKSETIYSKVIKKDRNRNMTS